MKSSSKKSNAKPEGRRCWVVRPGRGARKEDCARIEGLLLTQSVVGLDDKYVIGDILRSNRTRTEIKGEVSGSFPDLNAAAVNAIVGNVVKFAEQINVGDVVLSPSRIVSPRIIRVGIVDSDYRFTVADELPHQRRVKWIGEIEKAKLSVEAQRELGAARLFFECRRNVSDVMRHVKPLLNETAADR